MASPSSSLAPPVPVFRCACGGACPRCAAAKHGPALAVSHPGDRAEVEAERVADEVTRMPDGATVAGLPGDTPGPPVRVLRKATGGAGTQVAAGPLRGLGPGRPLDGAARSFFEPRFGRDLSHVRVHDGGAAAASARSLAAEAYTVGSSIVFGAGRYAPGSPAGRRLLAHELAHVEQQRGGAQQVQRTPDDGGVRHVFISHGVPDFLDCTQEELDADPDTSCCSEHTLGLIPGLYRTSREYADRAIERMRSGARMDGAIRRHFGSGALWSRATILGRLEQVRAELDRESSHRHLCRISLNARNSIGVELLSRLARGLFCSFNVLASARVGTNIATLCVDADGNPEGGWETLLHEMAHLAGFANLPARDDATAAQVAAGEFESYQGAEGYPNPAPYSLRNADSYSSFVAEVGASGWSQESMAPLFAPGLELGPALSLENSPRPGLEAGLTWTPLGSNLQMIVGARALWLPRTDSEEDSPPPPTSLRAYAGPELGLRWITSTRPVQFVLDVAGGAGPYVTVDDRVDPALAARLGLGLRVGGPSLGFGVGADFMRLFHLDQGNLVGTAADDWFGGFTIRAHWGGSSGRPR